MSASASASATMSRRAKKKGDNGIRVYNTKLFAELCRGVPEYRPTYATEDESAKKLTVRQMRARIFYEEESAAAKKKAAEDLEDQLKAAQVRKEVKYKALYKKIQVRACMCAFSMSSGKCALY